MAVESHCSRRWASPSPKRSSASGTRRSATPSKPTSRVVVLETDKVTVDVPAPAAGALAQHRRKEGDTVRGRRGARRRSTPVRRQPPPRTGRRGQPPQRRPRPPPPAPAAAPPPAADRACDARRRRAMADGAGSTCQLQGTRPGGRITKEDVLGALERRARPDGSALPAWPTARPPAGPRAADARPRGAREDDAAAQARRRAAARRRSHNAAILTTFNEVDMSAGDGAAQAVQREVPERSTA